jgi:hypothetical protein
MWRTPDGIRKLQGAEARLVRAAAAVAHERIKDRGEPHSCGAPAFDRLGLDRQLSAILAVARGLTDDLPPLPPDAWAEAAIFVLFEFVHEEIAFEMESSRQLGEEALHTWRRLVRDVLVEDWKDDPAGIPALDSTDVREWDFCVLCLADRILGSHDFLDEGIPDGTGFLPPYFAAEPPEWSLRQQSDLLDFLSEIAGEADRQAA